MGHARERALLVRGVALDRLDEVRHQVVAKLQLEVDSAPGLVALVARTDQRVVDQDVPEDQDYEDPDDYVDDRHRETLTAPTRPTEEARTARAPAALTRRETRPPRGRRRRSRRAPRAPRSARSPRTRRRSAGRCRTSVLSQSSFSRMRGSPDGMQRGYRLPHSDGRDDTRCDAGAG